MLSGAPVVDHWLTERVALLPDSTFYFLRRESLEGFPGIIWMESSESVTLPLADFDSRIHTLRSDPLTFLYWRMDYALKDMSYSDYQNKYAFFETARARFADEGV